MKKFMSILLATMFIILSVASYISPSLITIVDIYRVVLILGIYEFAKGA